MLFNLKKKLTESLDINFIISIPGDIIITTSLSEINSCKLPTSADSVISYLEHLKKKVNNLIDPLPIPIENSRLFSLDLLLIKFMTFLVSKTAPSVNKKIYLLYDWIFEL